MLTDRILAFKDKIQKGPVYGPFCKTGDPAFIEVAGFAGFDFAILDLEHGPNSVQSLQNLIRAAYVGGILPIVRVKEGNDNIIGEVLDIGAGGIQVPQITCREDAERVIRLARFSPAGMRGVCRFVRAADYSAANRFEYLKNANEAVIILQLESERAMANIEEILKVQGIDVVFIGPYDLSQSLGVPGQIDHPLVEQRMREIVRICTEKGMQVGTFVDTPENAAKWKKAGVNYISYSVDVGIFYEACAGILKNIR